LRAIAARTTSVNAIAAARSSGNGSDCSSAPPATVLIDAPVHGSGAVHSRTRSRSVSHASDGFATTPRTRIGCASGPCTASASPTIRPSQCGSSCTSIGTGRPDWISSDRVLRRVGSTSERHNSAIFASAGTSAAIQAITG
jgi:hypothetical protein